MVHDDDDSKVRDTTHGGAESKKRRLIAESGAKIEARDIKTEKLSGATLGQIEHTKAPSLPSGTSSMVEKVALLKPYAHLRI